MTTARRAGRRHAAPDPQPGLAPRGLEIGLAVVLVLTFATGGGSQDFGIGDALAQIVALPVLVASGLALAGRRQPSLRRWSIALAVFVVALPAVQLLPLPAGLWSLPAGRAELLADLHAAGAQPRRSWSLAPAMTERALWSQLPALAAFLGVIAVGAPARRRMAALVLGLITAGLLLGVLQMAAGQDSVINPFPEWVPVIGGVFANPNHQASALVLGALLGVAHWLERWRAPGNRGAGAGWAGLACAVLCAGALPATDSRAGMLMVAPALAALLAASGAFHRVTARRLSRAAWAGGAGIILVTSLIALRILLTTLDTEARWPMATASAALAKDAWPLGVGVGAFRPWFEQAGPDALLGLEYINHAHNEYVQWWLEGGLVALALLAAVLGTLAAVAGRLLIRGAGPVAQAAWLGVVVLLAASIVDYPLRTPALMTLGAFLSGLAVAQATRADTRWTTSRLAAGDAHPA